jgi:hypothetical protein
MGSSQFPDMLAHPLFGPALAIRAIGAQCIPDIYNCEDACGQWDLLAL